MADARVERRLAATATEEYLSCSAGVSRAPGTDHHQGDGAIDVTQEAVNCCIAVPEHERRSGTGLFRRWHG